MKLTRRNLLTSAAAATASAALNSCTKPPEPTPEAIFELEPKWVETKLGDTPVRLRGYNGQVPGPLMTISPGKPFRVHFKNSLTNRGGGPPVHVHNVDVPHDFEGSNLHMHGLDTEPHLFDPIGTTDPKAKMISIKPGGGEFNYAFKIPADHPPGLYWYHPHQHGSTAVQAVSGMAGPVIVKGPIDEVPEIKAARDIVLAIQDIGLFPSDEGDQFWTYNPRPKMIWQTFKGIVQTWDPATKAWVTPTPPLNGGYTTGDYARRYFLLNGQPFYQEDHSTKTPTDPTGTQLGVQTFNLAPGEVVRFRMLNGCSDNYMPIQIDGHQMQVLALDGVNFEAPRPETIVSLAPANRVEFLLKASDTPGTYNIVQNAQSEQFLQSDRKVIATIVVAGTPKPMPLPAKLPVPTRYYPLIKPGEIKKAPRIITFSTAFPAKKNPQVGMDFMLDGVLYDETVAGQVVELDTCEEWHLVLPKGESEGHPFHIHVNHFEVISVNGVAMPPGVIKDTIWIPKPGQQDSIVVIRSRFKEFTGKAVFHCHILPHEDTGMMSNVTILKPTPK